MKVQKLSDNEIHRQFITFIITFIYISSRLISFRIYSEIIISKSLFPGDGPELGIFTFHVRSNYYHVLA